MALGIALGTVACDRGFDRAAWAAEKGNLAGESRRAEMLDDAERAGVRRGATRAQVLELLGTPDASGPAHDVWYIGRSAVGPSYESFTVRYGSGGHVEVFGLTRD